MLKKRLIPCLDIDQGRVVKGVQFTHLQDAGDPVELARLYAAGGADELVLLDISATCEGRRALLPVVKAVASELSIPFTVGGGVKSVDDIETLLLAGADKVAINSAAVADPALITCASRRFGSQCVVLAIDVRNWEVVTHGGRRPTGRNVIAWARKATALGAGEILLTSMDRDGMQRGYDLELTRAIAQAVTVPIIASGGGGSPEDLALVLTEGQADAALAASIFHFGQLTLNAVKQVLMEQGVAIRVAE